MRFLILFLCLIYIYLPVSIVATYYDPENSVDLNALKGAYNSTNRSTPANPSLMLSSDLAPPAFDFIESNFDSLNSIDLTNVKDSYDAQFQAQFDAMISQQKKYNLNYASDNDIEAIPIDSDFRNVYQYNNSDGIRIQRVKQQFIPDQFSNTPQSSQPKSYQESMDSIIELVDEANSTQFNNKESVKTSQLKPFYAPDTQP